MDYQSIQPKTPIVPIKSPFNPFNKTLFIYLMVLLVGFFLGFVSWYIVPFGKPSILPQKTTVSVPISSPKPTNDESKLFISLSLLTNPIVYQWHGSVEGKMTKKDEHTFTLVDEKGNNITITDLLPNGDVFKTMFLNKDDRQGKPISLKDIPVGSIIRGGFFIFKGYPNIPIGSEFVKK